MHNDEAKMTEIFCTCNEKICGHPEGEQCGKPINQSLAKSNVNTERSSSGKKTGGWVCDECYKRVDLARQHSN